MRADGCLCMYFVALRTHQKKQAPPEMDGACSAAFCEAGIPVSAYRLPYRGCGRTGMGSNEVLNA